MQKSKRRDTTFVGSGNLISISGITTTKHYEGYFCRVYKCDKPKVDDTGYCADHVSPLRTGLAPYTPGCAPVIKKEIDCGN